MTSKYSASSCTGPFSGEMSLAAVSSTVNNSKFLPKPMEIRCVQCFDRHLGEVNIINQRMALCLNGQGLPKDAFRNGIDIKCVSICFE